MQRLKNILLIVLFLTGVIGIVDAIVISIYTNLNTGTILPGVLGLEAVMYSWLKLGTYKHRPVIKNRYLRSLITAGIGAFVISFLLIEGLIVLNGSSQDNIRTDYLIILGGGIKKEQVSPALKERLDKGIGYLKAYPETNVIVSGGQGFEETIPESEAMKRYLVERGVDPKRIIEEDKSTSTIENFIFSKKILSDMGKGDTTKIMVITNDFHMFRAKLLAKRNGFEPYGISSPTPLSVRANCYFREYFAFVKSYLFDKG